MPLRSFGSVSKGELLKELFYPVTLAAGGSAISTVGFHAGATIDAAGEYCQIQIYVPEAFSVYGSIVPSFYVKAIGIGATNLYNLRLDWDDGQINEAYNNITGNHVAQGTFVQNQFDYFDIDPAWGPAVRGANSVGLRCTYEAAGSGGQATNVHVIGVILRWA